MKGKTMKEYAAYYMGFLFLITLFILFLEIRTNINKRAELEYRKDEQIKIVKEERDMYKKRWKLRDDVAEYYYKEYLQLKEKYEKLKSGGAVK
nr:MAG TPA: hypothetical protein [Caudoviricetes sp.]